MVLFVIVMALCLIISGGGGFGWPLNFWELVLILIFITMICGCIWYCWKDRK